MRYVLVAGFLIAGCGKAPPPRPTPPAPPGTTPAAEVDRPYLTDRIVDRFLASMEDASNPMLFLFAENPDPTAMMRRAERVGEFGAAALRYGFDGYRDYVKAWARISTARIAMAGEEFERKAKDLMETNIRTSEEQLRRTDLPPEVRRSHEDLIVQNRGSLAELAATRKPISRPEDLEVARRHRDRIEAAAAKLRPPK